MLSSDQRSSGSTSYPLIRGLLGESAILCSKVFWEYLPTSGQRSHGSTCYPLVKDLLGALAFIWSEVHYWDYLLSPGPAHQSQNLTDCVTLFERVLFLDFKICACFLFFLFSPFLYLRERWMMECQKSNFLKEGDEKNS
jgi:hypothetical protein